MPVNGDAGGAADVAQALVNPLHELKSYQISLLGIAANGGTRRTSGHAAGWAVSGDAGRLVRRCHTWRHEQVRRRYPPGGSSRRSP